MKTIFSILSLLLFNLGYSQVIIGDAVGTVPAAQKTSVLLEFAANQNKGIILPYVRTIPTGSSLTEGTILLDASTATSAKVMYYNGTWQNLSSANTANITSALTNQPNVTEVTGAKVIIGSNTSTADGVLVLESPNKAMVLPMVLDTNNIPDPAPGMMVYVNKTGAKRLAVFNGNKWTYWKP